MMIKWLFGKGKRFAVSQSSDGCEVVISIYTTDSHQLFCVPKHKMTCRLDDAVLTINDVIVQLDSHKQGKKLVNAVQRTITRTKFNRFVFGSLKLAAVLFFSWLFVDSYMQVRSQQLSAAKTEAAPFYAQEQMTLPPMEQAPAVNDPISNQVVESGEKALTDGLKQLPPVASTTGLEDFGLGTQGTGTAGCDPKLAFSVENK